MPAVQLQNLSAVLHGKKDCRVEDRPIPTPRDDEVLVKIVSTGICGSDIHYYAKGGIGIHIVEKPLTLGHESSGIVTAIGAAVTTHKIGDKVAVEPSMPCRSCSFCKSGRANHCNSGRYYASPPQDGSLCQYITQLADLCPIIPEGVSWKAAAVLQPLAIAIHIGRRSKLRAHQTVAVTGCGPLGLLCIMVAKAYGASTVIGIEKLPSRVAKAKAVGADFAFQNEVITTPMESFESLLHARATAKEYLDKAGVPDGVDLVIEASANNDCARLGMALCKNGGTYLQAGLGSPMCDFPLLEVASRELNVLGTLRYSPGCFQDGIDLVVRKKIDLDSLVDTTFSLANSAAAMQSVYEGKGVKTVVFSDASYM